MNYEELKNIIVSMRISESEITREVSLTNDSGLDSTERAELFAELSDVLKTDLSTVDAELLCE